MAEPDLIDGVVDRWLLASATREEPLDEVGFARIRRALRPAPGRRWAALAGVAASLLVAIGLQQKAERAAPGLKGGPALSVELSAAARSPDGRVERVDPNQHLSADDVVLLRYHATEQGRALLLRQKAGSEAEPLGAFALEAGTHDLAQGDQVMGISLAGESGRLVLWLVAAPGEAAPDLGTSRHALRGEHDHIPTASGFPIVVEPGHHSPSP